MGCYVMLCHAMLCYVANYLFASRRWNTTIIQLEKDAVSGKGNGSGGGNGTKEKVVTNIQEKDIPMERKCNNGDARMLVLSNGGDNKAGDEHEQNQEACATDADEDVDGFFASLW